MNRDEIVAEMRRKPDAHLLLEWLAERAVRDDDVDITAAAYFEALEDE